MARTDARDVAADQGIDGFDDHALAEPAHLREGFSPAVAPNSPLRGGPRAQMPADCLTCQMV
jgi:hypothetical protein